MDGLVSGGGRVERPQGREPQGVGTPRRDCDAGPPRPRVSGPFSGFTPVPPTGPARGLGTPSRRAPAGAQPSEWRPGVVSRRRLDEARPAPPRPAARAPAPREQGMLRPSPRVRPCTGLAPAACARPAGPREAGGRARRAAGGGRRSGAQAGGARRGGGRPPPRRSRRATVRLAPAPPRRAGGPWCAARGGGAVLAAGRQVTRVRRLPARSSGYPCLSPPQRRGARGVRAFSRGAAARWLRRRDSGPSARGPRWRPSGPLVRTRVGTRTGRNDVGQGRAEER